MPGMSDDKKGQRQLAEMVLAAFSDRTMSMHDMAETADGRVVENWIMDATHSGDAMGIPPSNQDVRVRGMELWRQLLSRRYVRTLPVNVWITKSFVGLRAMLFKLGARVPLGRIMREETSVQLPPQPGTGEGTARDSCA